jgi:glyoxylase-like metal-dependent hydrolase (beta-lactamase superfamily II)
MKTITFRIEKNLGGNQIVLHPTVLHLNDRYYLIDCGYEETFDEFVTALDIHSIAPRDLHAVIISHDDIDHLGALQLFKSINQNLIICCSEIEEPSVSGKVKSERLMQAEKSLPEMPAEYKHHAIQFIQQLKRIHRLEVNQTLKDNQNIEQDVVVVNTPGHTKGHISLYIPGERTVIANDAIVIEGGELDIANPGYTLDMNQAIKSVEKIRDLKPDKLICYHGGIMEANLHEKLDSLILKYKK